MHRYQWHTQAWRPRRKYWNHLFFTARKQSLRRLRFHRCLSVHGGGGVSASGPGGCVADTPRADTNPLGRHTPHGQTPPLGRHPPTGRHPQADAPGQTPPGQMVNKLAVHIPLEYILVQKMRPCLLATIALKLLLLCLRLRLALFRQLSQSTKKNFRFDEFG